MYPMYPFIIRAAEAELAERRRQADRYSVARTGRYGRRRRRRRFRPGELVAGFVGRARARLAARSPQPPISPGQAPQAAPARTCALALPGTPAISTDKTNA